MGSLTDSFRMVYQPTCRIALMLLLGIAMTIMATSEELAILDHGVLERADTLGLSGPVVVASLVSGAPPLDPNHPIWDRVPPTDVEVYPQLSVCPDYQEGSKKRLSVRALHNSSQVALHFEWTDPVPSSSSLVREDGTQGFPDAAALAVPTRYGSGFELPFIGMGDRGHPVTIWRWASTGSRAETLVAEGFGTLASLPWDGMELRASWHEGSWRIVFRRALLFGSVASENRIAQFRYEIGLVPIAFALWDGDQRQRAGQKHHSGWCFLRLVGSEVDHEAIREWTRSSPIQGDPDEGRRLMTELGCDKCHAYPGNPLPCSKGPSLTYAGGLFQPSFLLDSLRLPSKVVVPEPANDGKLSAMPVYDSVSDRQWSDLVAYLITLR